VRLSRSSGDTTYKIERHMASPMLANVQAINPDCGVVVHRTESHEQTIPLLSMLGDILDEKYVSYGSTTRRFAESSGPCCRINSTVEQNQKHSQLTSNVL